MLLAPVEFTDLAAPLNLCYRRCDSYNQTQFHQHKKFREPRNPKGRQIHGEQRHTEVSQ